MKHYYTLKENVLKKYYNELFVETGTYLGDSVELALNVGFKKIISVEIDSELQEKNYQKFKKEIDEEIVELIIGDTSELMDDIVNKINKQATFWLDAHVDLGKCGIKKCPIFDELESISKSPIKTHTILIDDLRCFGRGLWGEGIDLVSVKEKLLSINKDYKFNLEDGHIPNDILVDYI